MALRCHHYTFLVVGRVATAQLEYNLEFHASTKHIDISYQILCDLVEFGQLNIVYVNTHIKIGVIAE